jgi:hypothetical protein
MEALRQALERLSSVTHVPLDGRLSRTLDPKVELAPLQRRLDAMRERGGPGDGRRPPRMDADALWKRWQDTQGDLEAFTRRELRALCWDHRAAGSLPFLKALEGAGHLPARRAFVRGVWHAHQHHWRLPTADRIEKLVKAAVAQPGHRPRWLRTIYEHPRLLGEKAPRALARAVIMGKWLAGEVLQGAAVTIEGRLGRSAIKEALTEWVHEVGRQRSSDEVTGIVDAGRDQLLRSEFISRDQFRTQVEQLMELVSGSGPALRDALARLIVEDSRLGRPTQPSTAPNWVRYCEQARRTAVRLFAARDLKAFFEILIGDLDDEQKRRPFWEQYVNSPQLVDFAVACDREDRRRLQSRPEHQAWDVAHLMDAPDNHSAFLMRFNGNTDIIVAEMSKANKATYTFRTQVFEAKVGALASSRFRYDALRSLQVAEDRWVHNGIWQPRFAERLGKLGVRPGRGW